MHHCRLTRLPRKHTQTTRHLAEFNMIEPEMAFADLQDNMANAEAFVKSVVGHVLDTCGEDLQFFGKFYDKALLDRLNTVRAPALHGVWVVTDSLRRF